MAAHTVIITEVFRMAFKLNMGGWNSVFAVPSSVVDNYIKLASGDNLKVLLFFLRNGGTVFTSDDVAQSTGVPSGQVDDSVKFWEQRGLISADGIELVPQAQPDNIVFKKNEPAESPSARKVDLTRPPEFKPTEIAASVRGSDAVKFLFTRCEELYGRPLKHAEQNALMLIVEEAGLPAEVAIMLVEYCFAIGKNTPAYIKAMASDWVDNEIVTIEKAEERLRHLKSFNASEYELKRLFEMNSAFTKNQREYLAKWLDDYKFTTDMIYEAYQRTLDGAGKLSFPYMDKILQSWSKSGFTVVSQVNEYESKRREKTKEDSASSFDIDDLDKIALEKYGRE